MTAIAHIAELWRYPVKSMRGEQVTTLDLLVDGIARDRRYAIESSAAPAGKPLLTGRERASMLLYTASVRNGETHILTPQGIDHTITDPALLHSMQAALPQPAGTLSLRQSDHPLTDVRPVAILSLQTIAQLSRELATPIDPRRFRANILLDVSPTTNPVISTEAKRSKETRFSDHTQDSVISTGAERSGETCISDHTLSDHTQDSVISTGAKRSGETCMSSRTAEEPFPEDALVGHTLRLGTTATLRVTERDPRCRIVILDPETATPDPRLMKHLDRYHQGRLGIYAATVAPGPLRVGDPVYLHL